MRTNQPTREHKTNAQMQKVQQHLERTLEEQRLARLKAILQAKLESSPNKIQAT